MGQVIPVGGAIASPQADPTQRVVVCLSKMAVAVWGITWHRDPGGCSLSSLSKAGFPSLSLNVSRRLCPPFAIAQGKWLQMKIYLKCSLCLQLSVPGRVKPCCFSQLDVTWVLFGLWCYMLGSPAWGLNPTLLRATCTRWPLKYPCSSPVQAALLRLLCTPRRSYRAEVFSFVCGCKASLQLGLRWLFKLISLQFSSNSRLVLGGG